MAKNSHEQLGSLHLLHNRGARPKLIRVVAVILSLYALIEIVDCITACLMSLHLVSNPYPTMLFSEIQTLFDSQSIWLVPLFIFFTSLRLTSSIGLWRNRLWGFWLTIFVALSTLIMAPFLLPFTAVEMVVNGVIMMLLLIGCFGNTPIIRQ
jgi:uncharacterized membrane protein (DUF2068 family)